MSLPRSRAWLAAVLWGAILFVAAWVIPLGLVVGLVTVGAATLVALLRRRTIAFSGLLVGAGGAALVLFTLAEIGCRRAASCERAEATPALFAIATGLVVGGMVALRADRPR